MSVFDCPAFDRIADRTILLFPARMGAQPMGTFRTTIHVDHAINTPSGLPIALPQRTFFSAAGIAPSVSIQATLPVPTANMQDRQPAATDAERAVIHAEQKAPAARAQAAPMPGDAHERRPAFVETSMPEAAELIDAGDRDDRDGVRRGRTAPRSLRNRR
jgi:hypothetical protein